MIRVIAVAGALSLAQPALAEVDYTEVWHACDEAAADEGFAEAGVPIEEIRGRRVQQAAGRWEGKTLLIVTVKTTSGGVFCMADEDNFRVVHYKFKGQTIFARD